MSSTNSDDFFSYVYNLVQKVKYNYYLMYFSKSVQEILELARTILDEACNSSDACASRLFYTCRNIFEMYVGLVPEHHKKFLETIPQQVGKKHITKHELLIMNIKLIYNYV